MILNRAEIMKLVVECLVVVLRYVVDSGQYPKRCAHEML